MAFIPGDEIGRTGTICDQINQTEDTMKTASGLEYIEVEAGTGAQAEAGKTVGVHYTGKFQDGKVFDSSVTRGEPITFPLGAGRVIKGWDEGIALMKVGGKAQLVIPPHLAYGERGAGGVIPPNATLVFDVELVSVD
jgi:peptidylprolyl isomerase